MKTIGDKITSFAITGVKPEAFQVDGAFETITEESFQSKWKIIMYYPKSWTFVCPTEIVAYDKIRQDFEDRDTVLLMGSTDNEFCQLAWKTHHAELKNIRSWMFADVARGELSLAEQLGIFYAPAGAALRATFIVDPENVIQHVTVNNLDVGRNPDETLRVLDALQTGELCPCSRPIGGETL